MVMHAVVSAPWGPACGNGSSLQLKYPQAWPPLTPEPSSEEPRLYGEGMQPSLQHTAPGPPAQRCIRIVPHSDLCSRALRSHCGLLRPRHAAAALSQGGLKSGDSMRRCGAPPALKKYGCRCPRRTGPPDAPQFRLQGS
ncbi:hypothetical protein NDU88_007063 [Pleurodeles waltl]|uniref:Uncharacterized protein n=1 Tax=Pleurodeles waltl TaxID=8319 RepID=A0AAV7UMV0_PLEWA|nr:hypothetical protein NDU88_007063 [Pleurodeles waltl]